MSTSKKKIPIKRVNKFFSREDFDLEIQMGREAIEGDGNFTVVLYRVDRETTQYDDIYHEANANEVNYLPPVEMYVSPLLEKPENMTYNPDSARFLEDGNLIFTIYADHLKELEVDITVGDYIGYPVTETEIIYFSVTNAGEKNYNNSHTIMGYKGPYRVVNCAPVNADEFTGI
tara:strand:+ start:11545 stop:12066 length:522 start_codon:yes stop_codon:yes gene_type:complete